MPKNTIQHLEWTTHDPKRLKKFYGRIFDWNFEEAFPGYTMIEGVGGIYKAEAADMPIDITPYVNVADLAATEKKIKAAGGTIIKSQEPVEGYGTFTLFTDVDGNVMGLWQAKRPAKRPAAKNPAKRPAAKKKRSRS